MHRMGFLLLGAPSVEIGTTKDEVCRLHDVKKHLIADENPSQCSLTNISSGVSP